MERSDAQLLATATIVLGLVIAGTSRFLATRPRMLTARRALLLATVVGGGICALGVLYALYAFSPNAGR
jgi:hypothetical protein